MCLPEEEGLPAIELWVSSSNCHLVRIALVFSRKWLDSSALTIVEKASHHYKTVKEHHAEFHKTAARVVELVLAGKKSDAERIMSLGGEYAKISATLTLAMMEWKKSPG